MTSPSFHQLRQAGGLAPTEAPITLFVCGTPESAPSWWSPDSDIGPMEAAWIESLCAEHEAQVRELLAGEDRAARLLEGTCDVCQEASVLPLIEVDSEALCAGCCEVAGIDYNEAVERGRAPGERGAAETIELWQAQAE